MAEDLWQNSNCAGRELFALQVLGDEMAPEFPDRCVIVIEPTEHCREGMYVLAEVAGERWFRQYRRGTAGDERLVAVAPGVPPIILTGQQWRVLGVVVQRNIRRQIKHYHYAPPHGGATEGNAA